MRRVNPPFAILAVLAAACSTPKPPPKSDGDPISLSDGKAPPGASTTAAPPPATSSAPPPPASSAPPVDKTPRRTGSPIATHEGEDEVTATFGNGGGKSKLPGFTLLVPPGAVDQPTNFIIAKNKGANALKVTPYKGFVGEVYRVAFTRPEQPKDVKSLGDPYVLTLQGPPKSPEKLHLVIAIPAGGGKATYKVIAPKTVLTADSGPSFVFEIDDFPASAVVHLTSASE